MNWAHVHLLLNHIPVIGMGFGILLLFVALVRKSEELKLLSLGAFVLLGLAAPATYFTGEPAARLVQLLPGVTEQVIERHEDAALAALIGAALLGLVALGGLIWFWRRRVLIGWVVATTFVLSLAVGGLMAWTANLGGQIRHSEIRAQGKAAGSSPQLTPEQTPLAGQQAEEVGH